MISSNQALTTANLITGFLQVVPISWVFLLPTDLVVVRTRSGVDSTLVLNTDYTVQGGGGLATTGSITLDGLSGDVITIYRAVPLTQLTGLANLTSLPATTLETTYDRIVMQLQTMQLRLDRTLAVSNTSAGLAVLSLSAALRANKYVGFDGLGALTALAGSAQPVVQMSITQDASGIKFVNDLTAPGATKYYGTDGSGARGWFTYVSGGTVTSIAVTTANGISGTSSGGAAPSLTLALGNITPGTVTASGLVSINQATASNPSVITGTLIHATGADAAGAFFLSDSFAGTNQIILRRANGTSAVPSAIQANDLLGSVAGRGFGATGYGSTVVNVELRSTAIWTDTSQPTQIVFNVTATGSVTQSAALTLGQDKSATFTGNLVLSAGRASQALAPASGSDLCNKTYVDAIAGGVKPRTAVAVATTANISLTGEQTIDGVLTSGTRILVKNQSSTLQNGIYVTAAGAWARASDANTAGTLSVNQLYLVTGGTTQGATSWFILTAPTVLNTDPVVFQQYSSAGTYGAGTGLLLTGSTFSLDTSIAMLRAQNLADVANKATAKTNLNIVGFNVMDDGADNSGVGDSTTAFATAIARLAPTGGITNVILNLPVAGFGTPSNTWSGRPAITARGGLSGSTGFSALGNVNTDGYLCNIEIASIGSGYDVLTYTINRVNGSPIITLSAGTFDARIVSGSTVSVRHESLTTTCVVVTRDSTTQLTLSENMTFTNSDQFVFGFPILRLNGADAPTSLIPVLSTPKLLVIPPGRYFLPGGIGNLGGLSNVTVEAEGAEFYSTTNTGSVGVQVRSSTGITFNGGAFRFMGARYSVPAAALRSTRYAGQHGIIINCSSLVDFNRTCVYESFQWGVLVGGGTTSNTWLSQRVNLDGLKIINPLGDGIHVDTGAQFVRVTNALVVQPGDDALAVTGITINRPSNILFENCTVEGGIYRGCFCAGGDYVIFRNINGRGTHGPFCWAAADGSNTSPTAVTFETIKGNNLGDTSISAIDANSGTGIYAASMSGLTIRDVVLSAHSSAQSGNPGLVIYNINESTITSLESDEQQLTSTGTSVTLTGSANTDLDCQGANGFATLTVGPGRWLVTGSITARFSAGPGLQIWPVIYDGTTEYGGGATFQTGDTSLRNPCPCTGFVNVQYGTKVIRFKLKQSGGGVVIDAGVTAGPNSRMEAVRV